MCMASVSNYVISGSADSTSRVWSRDYHQQDTGRHTIVAVLVGHRGPIRCVTAFLGRLGEDPEEEYCTICTGSLDGVLKMWRVTRTNKNLSGGGLNQNGHEYFELQ
ncbi:hypothetical protein Dsin_013849 [Dipteronia sinensis]|uniref:Uncharacterized protein n=1 Tax=Dipteronia sinensis TaxID=43782 RepID=A0AAE0E9H7_9ROSI|nr:hypothetical protein Dsin_013849 [Dipteronia sinensis]